MTGAYPNAGQFHWSTEELSMFDLVGIEHGLKFSMELAQPFHRVVPVDSGGNLEHLILLTIYMGVVHVLLGLAIGFRDIWLHGDVHGNAGPIVALFDRGLKRFTLRPGASRRTRIPKSGHSGPKGPWS